MQLKYVGPKPIISHTGIEFDNNKEDKYAYLNIVIQLLEALKAEHFENKTYTYHTDTSRISDNDLLTELQKHCPNIEELTTISNHNIEEEIEHNIQRAQESKTLTEEDKETLQNNITIMHDYLIQRSINKSIYYCAINTLANELVHEKISYVIAPMFQKFAHVLHSVQGVLLTRKLPIDTKLEIYQEDGKLLVKLQVTNI